MKKDRQLLDDKTMNILFWVLVVCLAVLMIAIAGIVIEIKSNLK